MVPLIMKLIIVCITGSVFLAFTNASQQKMVDDEFKDDWNAFCQALNSLEQYRAKEETIENIVHGGIRGMLATLDPHTHFLDKTAFQYMQEEQEGSFFGIGISFDISPDGFLRVVSPIEGTPAYNLGIKAGDRIVRIDGESTKNITEVGVIQKLRGQRGTKVIVTIEREGHDELIDFAIVRDRIPLLTVREPYMIRPGIGYIKITQFSRPTNDELLEALDKLRNQGLKKLIIDLRNNPGGLLDQAVEVTDNFVSEGDTIVSTSGRIAQSKYEFKARKEQVFNKIPIVVLVNGGSASASEIVAGALQDLDRAIIVGTRSYGKGLVQRQYPLPLDTAIQITTAKYYTPSKRCIQQPYTTPHDRYFQSKEKAEELQFEDRDFYTSKHGRTIEGGGGIVPDIIVEQQIPDSILKLAVKEIFFNFAVQFSQDKKGIEKNFSPSDDVFRDFQEFSRKEGLDFDEKIWQKDKEQIKLWIAQEIISAFYGLEERLKVSNEHDYQLMKALEAFPEAEKLLATYYSS